MNNAHTELVRLTALFIEKYGSIIMNNARNCRMEYGYNTSGSSTVTFCLENGDNYLFEIIPQFRDMKIELWNSLNTEDDFIYRRFLQVAPFLKFDYTRVFEIFDFMKNDDKSIDSISSFKRFNVISKGSRNFFNSSKVLYEIKYHNFYKKINRRVKMKSPIDTAISFDNDMNIVMYCSINIAFSDRDFVWIKFNDFDDHYSVDNQNINKSELFNYISTKRRTAIINNINRQFKNIEVDIQFNEHYQEHIQLLEMLTI